MPAERVAVIAGATGLVGMACLAQLRASAEYRRVIAFVRRPVGIGSGNVEERVVSFDHLQETEIPAGADIYCALGTTIRTAGSREAFRAVDYGYPVALARRGVECGVRQFVLVSSVDAAAERSNFYLRTKAEAERDIAALPYGAVHIFRPSVLMGARSESRPGERIGIAVARAIEFLLVGSLRRYRAIAAGDVARAMVGAATRAAPGVHRYEYDKIIQLSS